jgi:hypothetical protein
MVDPVAATHEPPGPSRPNRRWYKSRYTPYPEKSIPLSLERQKILDSICALYSGSASEEDMNIYAEKAVYDDPLRYCECVV